MKDLVRGDNSFSQRSPSSEVGRRTERRRRGQTTPQHDLRSGEIGAANGCAGKSARAERFWDGDLDRVAGFDIQSLKPKGGVARKCSAVRQSSSDRGQPQ
jgi:hypothetical protein